MKKVLLLLLLLPITVWADVNDTTTLFNELPKCCVVINVRSTDCINCRSGSVNVINKFRGDKYKDKVIIVTDDKNMSAFFEENTDIFGSYKTIFDKSLSEQMSLGPSSTICYVEGSNIHKYLFNAANKDTLNCIALKLNSALERAFTTYKILDTATSDFSALKYNNDYAGVLSSKFQMCSIYDLATNSTSYERTKISDLTANKIYTLLKKHCSVTSVEATEARKMLRMSAGPMVISQGWNWQNNSAVGKISVVKMDTNINGKDTNFSINIYSYNFVARNSKSKKPTINFDNFSDFNVIDSINYKGNRYIATLQFGYEINADTIYLPYVNFNSGKRKLEQGREIVVPTDIKLMKCLLLANGNSQLIEAYELPNMEGISNDNFLIKLNGNEPIIVNNQTKSVLYLNTWGVVPFSDLSDMSKKIEKVYDISFTDNKMNYIAKTTDNKIVKANWNTKTKKVNTTGIINSEHEATISCEPDGFMQCRRISEKEVSLSLNKF